MCFPPLKLLGVIERTRMEGLDCVLLSERAAPPPADLYLHGGHMSTNRCAHWLFLDRINNQCKAVVTVPLYPKAHGTPSMIPSVLLSTCTGRMLEQSRAQDVVIMGDSAGGGLALALAQQIGIEGLARPKALVLISRGSTSPCETPQSMRSSHSIRCSAGVPPGSRRIWAGHQDVHSRLVSPINGPVDQLPPVSLFVGTHELLLATHGSSSCSEGEGRACRLS
jgi:acetyl esterase/lipase